MRRVLSHTSKSVGYSSRKFTTKTLDKTHGSFQSIAKSKKDIAKILNVSPKSAKSRTIKNFLDNVTIVPSLAPVYQSYSNRTVTITHSSFKIPDILLNYTKSSELGNPYTFTQDNYDQFLLTTIQNVVYVEKNIVYI